MPRKGCEFSKGTKNKERLAWHKKHPGEEEDLEVHHILGVRDGRRLGVPREALRSRRNAVALTKEDHRKAHENNDDETTTCLARAFIKLFAKLF